MKNFYLIHLQYLGYRLHGWQQQPELKTVEGLIRKTLKYVLGDRRIKILGSGRTDAMVSAKETAFELFLDEEPLEDLDLFLQLFNENLPPDIRAFTIRRVDSKFNVIKDVQRKEYVYYFAFGEKSHPFCAPILTTFLGPLDIELMREGARLFEGKHYFRSYCTRPSEHTVLEREIDVCRIERNTELSASFFPEHTYCLRIASKGFLRNQIRLIMGTLVQLGRGELSLEDIRKSLEPDSEYQMTFIAPGSGLMVDSLDYGEFENRSI